MQNLVIIQGKNLILVAFLK